MEENQPIQLLPFNSKPRGQWQMVPLNFVVRHLQWLFDESSQSAEKKNPAKNQNDVIRRPFAYKLCRSTCLIPLLRET